MWRPTWGGLTPRPCCRCGTWDGDGGVGPSALSFVAPPLRTGSGHCSVEKQVETPSPTPDTQHGSSREAERACGLLPTGPGPARTRAEQGGGQ